ncbi:hypothetical protein [Tessaracoccus sp. MC1756]|uniref:hypothetical protein n=1 Tax=Tessaracoccus sp. MC1756 TaxID=2760311 RepID=UPI0016033FC5|nr:hypothetical protein [Tessaracoccus sp. MC1756]MBB1508394.1 hypothetical protein [Tessaracoccus sp. MC1756]
MTTRTLVMRLAQVQASQLRQQDADATAPKADFDAVRDATWRLRHSAQRVLDADLRQSRDAVAEIARHHPEMQTVIGYLVADGERAARADLEEAVAELRTAVDERLTPHSPVPARLETQQGEVLAQADHLDEALRTARELQDSGTWQGEAAQAYRTAADTQAGALQEYAAVTRASAEYLGQAALLHRATFFLCAESLKAAAAHIDMLAIRDAGHLFARTRRAIAQVKRATSHLGRDLDGALRGAPALDLARGLEDLVQGAEVLKGNWPQGGEPPK